MYASGHRNKEITFRHSWDKTGNKYPEYGTDVIDDHTPTPSETDDITSVDSRSVSVGANIDEGGFGLGATVGWTRSIQQSATNYRDLTDSIDYTETLHKLEMHVSSDAAKDQVEGFVGCLSHFEPNCPENGMGGELNICSVEIEPVFANPAQGATGSIWTGGVESSYTELFDYNYNCPCTNPPCPEQ